MESHLTATGLVTSPKNDQALMIFHKKLQLWLPAGGHVDEGEMPHETVVREVFEETGLTTKIVDSSEPLNVKTDRETQMPAPRWVLHEVIPAHKEKVAHLHYDFLYHVQAESLECTRAEREVESIRWFTHEELMTCDTTDAVKNMYAILLR